MPEYIGSIHVELVGGLPVTVAETKAFIGAAQDLFTDEQLAELKVYLAINPEAGDLIAGGGGIRKVRWALPGAGKRSGARVIYFYKDLKMPLYLLAAYAKNEKVNISQDEKKLMHDLVKELVREFKSNNIPKSA